MNKKFIRIIPKMDIKNGLLIKGINLDGLRILGDPYNFAENYYKQGVDELIFMRYPSGPFSKPISHAVFIFSETIELSFIL